ncbi:helix-turn-helix transcriptional regulator, partial [Slackia isoflavoniconvertens]
IGDTTAGALRESTVSAGAALPHVSSSSDTTAQGHQIENALMADGQLNVDQLSSAEGHAAQKEAGIGAAAESAAEPDWRSELASFAQIYGLTPRETEICSYLVRGRSAKHIAEELVISENTVWSHVKNVYAKTGAAGKNALIELFEKSALGE